MGSSHGERTPIPSPRGDRRRPTKPDRPLLTGRARRWGAAPLVVAVVAAVALLLAGGPPAAARDLPTELAAGTTIWAPVVLPVVARRAPSSSAPPAGRLSIRTPEGTTTIVPVFRRTSVGGALWIQVGLPVLPNGTRGWVRRAALGGYDEARTRLVISTRALRATLYRGRARIFSAPIGIGRSRWPTPIGSFIVRNKLTRYASPAYGPIAFGTSARSAVLTDWPAGGYVGIHGTDRPELVPGRISHGCIRLRNPDILRLAELMPVGTMVEIR